MPDLPEEAVQAAADELEEAFKNVRFRFWICINRAHKYVTWNGDVASCDTCGLTSEMTGKRDALVRADERRKTAEEIAAQLRRVAAGRREYAQDAGEPMAKTLTLEASYYESAAKVAEGNVWTITGLLPSWRWTDEETRTVCETGEEHK